MNPEPRQPRLSHAAILFAVAWAVALAVRLAVLWQVRADPNIDQLSGDGAAYWQWATRIAGGEWAGSEVFYQTPLYPYFLAGLQTAGAGESGVRIIQAVLGSIGCGILALAARRMFSDRAGWIAAMLLAFYPPAISYDLQIDKPVLDIALACALVWCIARQSNGVTWLGLLTTGLVGGLLSLNRENALVLVAVIGCWLGVAKTAPRRARLKRVAVFVAGAAMVLLPVAIRNTLAGHELFLTSAQFGPNFYIGNNAQADGAYHALLPGRGDARFERFDATQLAEKDVGRTLGAGEVSRYWTHRTLRDIGANPARWAKLLARKFAMTFADSELADSDAHDRFVGWSSILQALDSFFGFGALLVLAALGVVLAEDRSRLFILVTMILALCLTMSLFFIFGRYRLAIVPMLVVLAAGAIAQLPDFIRQFSAKQGAMALLTIAATIGWLALAARAIPASQRGLNEYNRAKVLADRQKFDDAETLYREAIEENPNLSAAYTNLGLLLSDRGRLREAEPLLAQAIRLEPGDPVAHINYGVALARQSRLEEAIDQFRIAMKLSPASSAARYNLAAALMVQGQKPEAIQLLRPIASSDSPDPFARRAQAMLHSLLPATTRNNQN